MELVKIEIVPDTRMDFDDDHMSELILHYKGWFGRKTKTKKVFPTGMARFSNPEHTGEPLFFRFTDELGKYLPHGLSKQCTNYCRRVNGDR